MARRRTPVPHTDPSAAWERLTHHVSASGRHLGPGTEFSVHGEPGRFRFVEHVITPAGVEWITAHGGPRKRSEEHTSELQSRENLVCRLLLEKKKKNKISRNK